MSLRDKMLAVIDDVNGSVAEREELVEMIAIALLTRKNLFVLGDPGQAKSYAINLFRQHITGARQFERLLSKQTDEEQLFGRVDLSSLIPGSIPDSVLEGDGVYQTLHFDLKCAVDDLGQMKNTQDTFAMLDRASDKLAAYRKAVALLRPSEPVVQTVGKIPEADIVLLDEIFKCNDGVLNSLDRLELKVVTANIEDRDTRLAVLKNKQNGAFGQVSTTITLEELIEMQREVAAIPVPDSANELTDDILCELRKSMAVSDRKYLGYYPIAQARAWLSGHDKVEPSDLLALKDYLWRLPADREKVESVLNRFCINPMQEKVNDVREMALDSQAGFEEACGDGSRADLARKAFIKLRGELVRLYQKQCELRTSAQSDSETALMDGLLNDLEDISRRAHEKTGFTYTPLSEIAALN